MTTSARRPGPESTLAEVRELLIDAAIELLASRGVEVGMSHITLSDAIAQAGVTRSTAYRSLADDALAPQAVLHRELLRHLLTRYTRATTMTTLNAVIGAELERQAENLASPDVALRTEAMRGILRVGANQSYRDVIDAPERSSLTAIYGALRSSGVADWRFDALREGERGLTKLFAELYSGLVEIFEYKVKPPFTLSQFATAGASLIEGMAMRHGLNEDLEPILRPTGPHGEPQRWTAFANAFEALFLGYFEPRNQARPFADLARF